MGILVVQRIAEEIKREEERHKKKMKELREKKSARQR